MGSRPPLPSPVSPQALGKGTVSREHCKGGPGILRPNAFFHNIMLVGNKTK